MKRIILQSGIAIVIAGAFLASCKKASSPVISLNPQVSFSMKADNFVTPVAAANPGNGVITMSSNTASANVTWTSGVANISHFQLEAKKHGVETEITSNTLTHVDLFALTPAFISANIDTGTYSEIEVRVVLSKTTTADLPLTLKGNFTTASGLVLPVELDFNDDAVIKAGSDNVVVDGGKDLVNKLSMHLNKLLWNVSSQELDATTRGSANGILISSTVNVSIYNKIKANLTSCSESKGFEKHEKSEREHEGRDHK